MLTASLVLQNIIFLAPFERGYLLPHASAYSRISARLKIASSL